MDIETTSSAEKGLELLDENDFDAIVSDYQMPEMDGLEFLKTVREKRNDDIPFIIFTGKGREDVAMEALNLGANRYLQKRGDPKSQYSVLAQAIVQEVEHGKAEEKLQESEAKYRAIVEHSHDAILIYRATDFLFVNDRLAEITGYTKDELYDMNAFELFHPDDRERVEDIGRRRAQGEDVPNTYQARVIRKDGTVRICEFAVTPITYKGEYAALGPVRDITERKRQRKNWREARSVLELFLRR